MFHLHLLSEIVNLECRLVSCHFMNLIGGEDKMIDTALLYRFYDPFQMKTEGQAIGDLFGDGRFLSAFLDTKPENYCVIMWAK